MNREELNRKYQVIRTIRAFRLSCDKLAKLVNYQLFDGGRDWRWVGDDKGGICDFEDSDFLTPEEMVLILEKKVTYDQYAEWRDSNLAYQDKGHINLKSFLMGCRHYMINNKTEQQ